MIISTERHFLAAISPRIGRKTCAVDTFDVKPVVIEIPTVATRIQTESDKSATKLPIIAPMAFDNPVDWHMLANANPPPKSKTTSQANCFCTFFQLINGAAGVGSSFEYFHFCLTTQL